MLKITLIDVGTPRNELNEPLGIEVLAGALRQRFSASAVVNMEYLQLSNGILHNKKALADADLVGISSSLYSLKRTQVILDEIHSKECSKIKRHVILLGNLLGTFAYREMLERHKDVICVRGEGEDAICGIVQMLLESAEPDIETVKDAIIQEDIPNLALICNNDIKLTRRRLVDLEKSAKPARDFLPLVLKKRGIVRVEASRGCPWGVCKFCAIGAKYGVAIWRPFRVDRVVEELEELSRLGVRNPYYTDEDFMGSDPDRALDIANRIISAKEAGRIDQKLNFYVNMPIGTIVGDEKQSRERCLNVLETLKKAGLREVFVGVESGAGSQIARYGKRATAERNIQALNILRSLDLTIDVGFMMFDPEMTFSDLKENLEFIRKAELVDHDARDIKKVRIEPGTILEKELMNKGIIGPEFDVNSLSYSYAFRDALVQKVFDVYEDWEKGVRELVYSLQGRSRGEIPSESERKELKRLLGRFRRLDFEFLEACTNLIEKSPNDFASLELIKRRFEEIRAEIMKELETRS